MARDDPESPFTTFLESLAYDDSDFTLVIPNEWLNEGGPGEPAWLEYCRSRQGGAGKATFSFEFGQRFCKREARLQVSRAYAGDAWTVTVRWDASRGTPTGRSQIGPDKQSYVQRAIETLNGGGPEGTKNWKPTDSYQSDGKPVLFSIEDIVECLHKAIFLGNTEAPGLVLITGRTGSGKSEVARGLVWKRIHEAAQKAKRRPHLLTYEDPIEVLFAAAPDPKARPPIADQQRPIDYTPRQKNKDCKDLPEVLKGALRQTPTVVYIGEIRERKDLRAAMEFAGTGHLVVATAHAGDLVESVGNIMASVRADEPDSRAVFVPRIRAVVHMAPLKYTCGDLSIPGFVPSLYRQTSRGMQSLIADGLFSLLPHFAGIASEFGSLGRQALADALCNHVAHKKHHSDLGKDWTGDTWRTLAERNRTEIGDTDTERLLIRHALEEDLHGR